MRSPVLPLDHLVCAAVSDGAERRLQSWWLAGLVGAGLAVDIASPLLAVLHFGSLAVAAPLLAAATLLAAAACLSRWGALDPILWAAGSAVMVGVGCAAAWMSIPLGAIIAGLVILPVEAARRGLKRLAVWFPWVGSGRLRGKPGGTRRRAARRMGSDAFPLVLAVVYGLTAMRRPRDRERAGQDAAEIVASTPAGAACRTISWRSSMPPP